MTSPAASSDPRYFDFDEWFAEQEKQTIPFKLLGKIWQLPADVDATKILRIQRLEHTIMQVAVTGEVPAGFEDQLQDLSYEKLCRDMVGDTLVDQWLDKGVKHQMLQAVTRRLYALYTGTDPDQAMGAKPGEAKPRTKAGRRTAAKKAPADRRRSAKKTSTPKTSSG